MSKLNHAISVTLYRDDFETKSDGSSAFDYILRHAQATGYKFEVKLSEIDAMEITITELS